MAELPEETTNTVLNLERGLLKIVYQVKATEFAIALSLSSTMSVFLFLTSDIARSNKIKLIDIAILNHSLTIKTQRKQR